ncbi:GFA family protein [Algibacillus agarilyticus]|uniref:GFA family protein n=1 Tax=Algibacillus agarilyticus TaxID=2234133 RepID=UPI000DCFCCAC|nr:GFA family protein [Algibacillus agarilyticus]
MSFPIQATCQCGQVSYQLNAAPLKVLACHCTECQKLSTSAYSITALVATKDIEFSGEMKEWSRIADSGKNNIAKFCPYCGNRIYHYSQPDDAFIKLKLKPVEPRAAVLFEPNVHVWVGSKQSWFTLPLGVETHTAQPQFKL